MSAEDADVGCVALFGAAGWDNHRAVIMGTAHLDAQNICVPFEEEKFLDFVDKIKEKIKNGQLNFGTHCSCTDLSFYEMCGRLGYDYVWIDNEHGGMTNTMADMKGVDIWANFTETDKGVLCELRSSKYNINPIAVKYGGGGHAKASGATVADKETAMAMLRDLDAMMGESV